MRKKVFLLGVVILLLPFSTAYGQSGYGQGGYGEGGYGGAPPPDSDGDGMPDYWEGQYAVPTDPNVPGLDPLVDDASLDNDNDGMTNLNEYYAETDPTLAASVFEIISIIRDNLTGNVDISWSSVAGKTYRVYGSDSPFGDTMVWSPLSGSITGTGGSLTWTDTGPFDSVSERYYKVKAE